MKAGTTQTILFSLNIDLGYVSDIIFTLQGDSVISKSYPADVSVESGRFAVSLTQEETIALAGKTGRKVYAEAQINFLNKAVAKSHQQSFFIGGTLATAFIADNTSDGKEPIEAQLLLDGEVVYVDGGGLGGTSDYNALNNLPKVNGVTVKGTYP